MKKIIAGTSAVALSLSFTSVALAAEDTGDITLEVEIESALAMDCYQYGQGSTDTTVELSDTTTGVGKVAAGVPSVGASTCEVTTGDDNGYHLSIEKTTEDVTWGNNNGTVDPGEFADGQYNTNEVLFRDCSDGGVPAICEIPDLTAYEYNTNTAAGPTWSNSTVGLGFSVVSFPDPEMTNNRFDGVWDEGTIGTDVCLDGTAVAGGSTDSALYAGIPEDPEPISAVTQHESNVTATDVCYKVDVNAAQRAGQYGGQVTFTAVTDASGYAE